MSVRRIWIPAIVCAVAGVVWAPPAATSTSSVPSDATRVRSDQPVGTAAHRRVLSEIEEPTLRELLGETVERNPGVSVAAAQARAASQRAPQVRAWPDPVVGATGFLQSPETRTGPQRLALSVSQTVPRSGRLERKELAATHAAAALAAEVDAERLRAITMARELYHEIALVDWLGSIAGEFRNHLLQHEEISRARYSTGVGGGQDVLKLQAEITRVDQRLLDLESRRATLKARLNALRDRPATTPIEPTRTDPLVEIDLDLDLDLDAEGLLRQALANRPELAAANARLAQAAAMVELAELGYRPDFKVGLSYTLVEPRDDGPGRLLPPEGNGDDIFGIMGGMSLPLRRGRLAAALAEAQHLRLAAERATREVEVAIATEIGDLTERVPLAWRRLRLVEDLLIIQAEESLESAQAGYIAGKSNALDLLDAEHVLFEARTAQARAATDLLVGLAQLEGALGEPLETTTLLERGES